MKVIIIHLSDIHLKKENNSCEKKFSFIGPAVQNEERGLSSAIVVVSGDIAFSGLAEEYEVAKRLLAALASDLKTRLALPAVQFVFVPGNHDCDFSVPNSVRDLVIEGVRSGKVLDGPMLDCCCSVQRQFVAFMEKMAAGKPSIIHSPLHWDYIADAGQGATLQFRCYNSAWMSHKHEQQGGLHMPELMFGRPSETGKADFVVSLFHHPYNWMPPATFRRFRSFIEETSDVILTGHEHEPDHYQKYTFKGEINEYIEGAVFQETGSPDRSGFHVIYVDLVAQLQRSLSFFWQEGRFVPTAHTDNWVRYSRGRRGGKRDFQITEEFARWLEDPGASYQHPAKPDLRLKDIYVFPNLKQFELKKNSELLYGSIIEGRDLLKTIGSKRKVILFGQHQSGKTTLTKILLLDFYNKDFTPVLVSGDQISRGELKIAAFDDLVENQFQRQYNNPLLPQFQQLDRDKVVVIVDDVDHAALNAKGRLKLLEELSKHYERVILLADDVVKLEEIAASSDGAEVLTRFEQFDILQFGHLLRNKLITQWYSIGSEFESDPQETTRRIHHAEKLVTALLGKNYLPHFPVFILSLIQAQDSTSRPNTTAGTYGSLYEALITNALTSKSTAGNLDLRMTYLSELAYMMFSTGHKRISDDEWELFHRKYCDKFQIRPSRDTLKKEFAQQGLVEFRDEKFGFRHSASYYYFVARYLRDNLSDPSIKTLVSGLLPELHKQENASIWLFLTHLSKDPFLVETVVSHANKIYKDLQVARFEDDVEFLQAFADNVEKIVLKDMSFEELQEERLRKLDAPKALSTDLDDVDESADEPNELLRMLSDLNLALRTLEILGQLVKNFPGSLRGADKMRLVEECYHLGLRCITMMFGVFNKDVLNFIDLVVDRVIDKHPEVRDRDDLKNRVRQFMFWMVEGAAFAVIKRISQAVGHSQLSETYRDVRAKSDTNAVALIDMSIRLDNLGFPDQELQDLAKRFEKNIFSGRILQQLTVQHFYLFPTDYDTKQKICNALDIEIKGLRGIDVKSSHERVIANVR